MKRLIGFLMALALLSPSAVIAQDAYIEAGTVWVIVAVWNGLEREPVGDGLVPPTFISCQGISLIQTMRFMEN